MRTDKPAERPDFQPIINTTLVALIGMLGGFIIWYVFGHGVSDHIEKTTAPSRQSR